MVVRQGDIWWCDLPPAPGSGPGFRRPVLIVQGDPLNRSRIPTVVCVPLTSNLTWKDAPGNVVVDPGASRLVMDSVANVSQLIAVERQLLTKHVSRVPKRLLDDVLDGIDLVLDR